MSSRDVLFLDIETSGLDENIHSILSCGIILTDDKLNVIQDGYFLIQPKKPFIFKKRALEINHFSSSDSFENHIPIAKFINIFHTRFGQQNIPLLAGWNVFFDIRFLQKMYLENNLDWPFGHRHLDIQSVSLFLNRGKDLTLHKILQKYNKTSKHHALDDAYDCLFLLKKYYKCLDNKNV